jgi:hypothetical protein
MICSKCGAVVPDDKLVCDCFAVEADNEAQRIGLARFLADEGWLYLTHSGDHLLPSSRDSLTLCRLIKVNGDMSKSGFRRFKNPEVDRIHRAQLQKPWSDRVCQKCMAVVYAAAGEALQSANAERSLGVMDRSVERQQETGKP